MSLKSLFSKKSQRQIDLSGQAIRSTATYGVVIFALLSAMGVTLSAMDYMNYSLWLPVLYILFLMIVGLILIRRIDHASRHLKKHHTLLKEAFEFAPAGRLIVDNTLQTIYANDSFPPILKGEGGTDLDYIREIFAKDSKTLKQFDQMIEKSKSGHADYKELSVVDTDGEEIWISVKALPIDGFQETIQWRFEEITDQRAIQKEVKEEQSKLSDFLNNAHVGFYAVNQDGHFIFLNDTMAQWLDCDKDQLVQSDLKLHDIIVENCSAYPAYSFSHDDDVYQEKQLMIKTLSGKVFRASIGQTLVKDDAGNVTSTRSIVRDLTPEHEWQTALRRSNERFELFFQSAPNGIALLNAKGCIDECNEAFATILGHKVGKLIRSQLVDYFKEKHQEDLKIKLSKTIRLEAVTYPLELELKDDQTTIQLFAKCLDIGDVEENAIILHINDYTEQKNLEIQFSQSQKMQAIGQLAGGVAHDFNNLLTAMIGFCDLLLMRHKPGDQSYADLMMIKQDANRGANLVRQLLAFSRKQTLNPALMNITDILADLSNLLSRLIGEQIEMNIYHGRDLGLVKVDQGQFEQVIINLAVNARDAMSSKGVLNIRTLHQNLKKPLKSKPDNIPAGDYVCIEVTDTGTGISKQNQERIFDPFFSTKEVGSGTGLGLSTVYGIISQSKGYIHLESKLRQGSKFTIYLPRIVQKEVIDVKQEEKSERIIHDLTGRETILLVEDEDPVRLFSTRALSNKGYQVIDTNNGEIALDILKSGKKKIDLLISDVVMPHMDGPTLYKNVQKLNPDLKFIFISGYAEDRFQDQFENMDEINFLPKPFTLKELAEKVRSVLEK